MKKTVCLLLSALIILASLCACGGNKLVGTWKGETDGVAVSMTFEDDGTGNLASMGLISVDFDYEVDGSKIIIAVEGEESEPFDYEINGDELTLISDGETMTFTRAD